MRWTKKLSENIKKGLRNWLNVMPASPYVVQINEVMDFELCAIRNRIWYRGDGNELEQFYQQTVEYADKNKFWASRCTPGMDMRKIHTGLPGLMVKTLTSIVLSDMNDFEFEDSQCEAIWKDISADNNFSEKIEKALSDTLCVGDGAFKITIDTSISEYPIFEWYSGEKVEIVKYRDRIKEIIFKTIVKEQGKEYTLHEHYGYGYVYNELYRGETKVDTAIIGAADWSFDKRIILAVPFKIFNSKKFNGRGGSVFDGKLDNFDALDEVWSQWMDAVRAGRSKTYIPDCLIPRDYETGKIIPPNPFDNRYFGADGDAREGQKNVIITDQPTIPCDSYLSSYVTALDLCLQGVLSPSTLGIDVKKLDNAEAQREKEKTTLYSRNSIVEAIQDAFPKVIATAINAYKALLKQEISEVKVNITFGEYANPSFESQVETIAKGKQGGIMSIEACVEELYGDTKDEQWKKEEVKRLKEEQGIQELEEPTINLQMDGI